MARIAIVYHSGYGHTAKVAEHVLKGAKSVAGAEVSLLKAEDLGSPDDGPWDTLHEADAIVFGSPTYMGSASAVMKKFMEATSKTWMKLGWKDKLAAGFTNSGSLSGDKVVTLQQFATLAAQHGMLWISTGMPSGYNASNSDFDTAENRAGHFIGLGTQSLTDLPAEKAPDEADLKTAEAFGKRIAETAQKWAKGS